MEDYDFKKLIPFVLLGYNLYSLMMNWNKSEIFCRAYTQYLTLGELQDKFIEYWNHSGNHQYQQEFDCPVIGKYNDKAWKQIQHLSNFWGMSYIQLDENLIAKHFGLTAGGMWKPLKCNAVHNTTILVPYRNRSVHLKKLVKHLHTFLQLQMVEYRIVIVEQLDNKPFNKGALLNAGFLETSKHSLGTHCYIFQDVDFIPLHLENIYGCVRQPRHLSTTVNTFRYFLPCDPFFGGVFSITQDQFIAVNGFSNMFTGWGGEDDNIYFRLVNKGLKPWRLSPLISTYRMLPHVKANPNPDRFEVMEKANEKHGVEGLSNVNYSVANHVVGPLYTLLQIQLN